MPRGNDITLSLGDALAIVQECDPRGRSVCVRVALQAHSVDIYDALDALRTRGVTGAAALEYLTAAPGRGHRYDDIEVLRAFELLKASPLGRARVIQWARDEATAKAAQ